MVSSRERDMKKGRPMERRRTFSPEEKLQIVLEGVANEKGVSGVCRCQIISVASLGCCAIAGRQGFPISRRRRGLHVPQPPSSGVALALAAVLC